MRDDGLRASCEARLAYAREHITLIQQHYAQEEARYVDKHLRSGLELTLRPENDQRSYVERTEALKADFARTERGQKLQGNLENRAEDLIGRAQTWADQALEIERSQTHPEPVRDKGLSREFRKAYGR